MKILFVSDSLSVPSGLTQVCTKFMYYMKKKHADISMAHLTITGERPSIDKVAQIHGNDFLQTMGSDFKIFEAKVNTKDCFRNFEKVLMDFKPDVIITNQDPWWCEMLSKSPYRDSFIWVFYATIESPSYPEIISRIDPATNALIECSIKNIIASADIVIPATFMAKTLIEDWGITCTEPVYHGVEPAEELTARISKREMFGSSVSEDSFVFITAGVNSERKAMYRTMLAFSEFIKKVDNPERFKIYMHTDIKTPQGGTDLYGLARTLNLNNNVLFQPDLRVQVGEPRIQLLMKYRAADAYIALPYGEGFGLCFLEAMQQGLPVIYINHGGHAEYCSKVSPFSVKVKDCVYAKYAGIKWALADIEDAANVMLRVVTDSKLAKATARLSQEYVRTQSWESKADELYSLIEKHMPQFFTKHRSFHINTYFKRYI